MPRAVCFTSSYSTRPTVRFQVPKCEFVTPDRKLLNLRADASPATSTSSSPYSLRSPRRVLHFSPREGRFAMHLATIGNVPSPLLHAQARSICVRSSNATSSFTHVCASVQHTYIRMAGPSKMGWHRRHTTLGHNRGDIAAYAACLASYLLAAASVLLSCSV